MFCLQSVIFVAFKNWLISHINPFSIFLKRERKGGRKKGRQGREGGNEREAEGWEEKKEGKEIKIKKIYIYISGITEPAVAHGNNQLEQQQWLLTRVLNMSPRHLSLRPLSPSMTIYSRPRTGAEASFTSGGWGGGKQNPPKPHRDIGLRAKETRAQSFGLACGNCQVSGISQIPGFFTPTPAPFQAPVLFKSSTKAKKHEDDQLLRVPEAQVEPPSPDLAFRTLIGRREHPAPAAHGGGTGATAQGHWSVSSGSSQSESAGFRREVSWRAAWGLRRRRAEFGPGFRPLRACWRGECGALGLAGRADPAQPRSAPGDPARRGRLAGSAVARPGWARPAEPSVADPQAVRAQRSTRVRRRGVRPRGGAGVASGVGGRAGLAPVGFWFPYSGAYRRAWRAAVWMSAAQTSGTSPIPGEDRSSVLFLYLPRSRARPLYFGRTVCHVPGTRFLTT